MMELVRVEGTLTNISEKDNEVVLHILSHWGVDVHKILYKIFLQKMYLGIYSLFTEYSILERKVVVCS